MQPVTEGRSNAGQRGGLTLFRGMRPFHAARAIRDALAGIELAAMSIPQALGYTSIAGMVAADSATAAILAGGISGMAPLAARNMWLWRERSRCSPPGSYSRRDCSGSVSSPTSFRKRCW